MGLCKFSSQVILNNTTSIDNTFLNEYMPYADSEHVKIYLYGLYMASIFREEDNAMDNFCNTLKITEEKVIEAFEYWESMGVVSIISKSPFEVVYLPVNTNFKNLAKYNKSKFVEFNLKSQGIICERQITPKEFSEYYDLIEKYGIEQCALLMIMKYCVDLKGGRVNYPYIITVAKNWIEEGILKTEQVEKKLDEMECISGNIVEILKTLGIKRKADANEFDLYKKWTNDLNFTHSTINFVAKSLKRKGGMQKLDEKLSLYYERKLFDMREIESFENEKTKLYNLAKSINNKIGVYYENLDPIISNYILKWLDMGYEEETLLKIANDCFFKNFKTLDLLDKEVVNLYANGVVSEKAYEDYTAVAKELDNEIQELLSKLKLSRYITKQDRIFYKNWTLNWNINKNLIDYVAEKSVEKGMPMAYMNKILSSYFNDGIKTVEQAKEKDKKNESTTSLTVNKPYVGRSYSESELNDLYTNLDEVEI